MAAIRQRGGQALKQECIEACMYRGRQVGKELGQEEGIMAGCQTKRQAGIEAEMHRGRRRH
jgi:hypothetical protein